jgi:hypothetical protein
MMEQIMTRDEIWEKAESACYHSGIDDLTVKHIDLVADFGITQYQQGIEYASQRFEAAIEAAEKAGMSGISNETDWDTSYWNQAVEQTTNRIISKIKEGLK